MLHIIYKMIIFEESFFQVFQLYLDLDNLYTIFSTEGFLLIFADHHDKFSGINNFYHNAN